MRTELRTIQQRVGITFIYITHDQGEALTMSDHVAVMRDGVVEQVADGRTIYDDPATAFVASFVGENNCFSGRVVSTAANEVLV
jgi:spermidine/putrescine transport system ATP-binding protein